MKFRSIAVLSTLSLSLGVALVGSPSPAQAKSDAKFICSTSDGAPATVALTSRGYVPVIRWTSNYFSRSGYSAQDRCRLVSGRFQDYYTKGKLNYLTPGTVKGQPVICVATRKGGPCAGVLFTLKPNTNPWTALNQLLRVRVQAGGVLNESTGGSLPSTNPQDRYLDMQQYLDTAAVEPMPTTTGAAKGLW